jgi:hypothetical protein
MLFREMVSWSLSKNIRAIIKKIVILCFWAHLKGPDFWNCSVHIHWTLTYDGYEILNSVY